ncbi:phenylacetate--CoA ligase, partial [Candidatus Nomurabacteria bacterium]|nr:phenylacetate--CoA ligase [Candidatus Nomurabacteria bacterium]
MYSRDIETMPEKKMKELQLERLKWSVKHAYNNVPFYKKKYDEAGFHPDQLKSLDDMRRIPFLKKQDMRDNYPYGLFAVPLNKVVRVHASSGTTGNATVVGYTKNDVEVFAEVVARSLSAYGVTENDVIQVAYGYGLFTGGLGLHYGAEKLGTAVVPISGGNTDKQLQLMEDFGSTVLACTPSYAAYLGEAALSKGIDTKKLPLRVGIFGAEPWTPSMRLKIEDSLNIKAYDIYGLSEIIGPGVSGSCECQNGLHISEDHFLPEIIDPDTLENMNPNQTGELIFTTLSKEAMPLLRYRTRDLSSLDYTACPCGRTTVRMAKIFGRSDDM